MGHLPVYYLLRAPIKGILISSNREKKIIYNNLEDSWKSQGSRFASVSIQISFTSSVPLVLHRRCLTPVHGGSFINSVGRSHQEDLICQLTHEAGLTGPLFPPLFLEYSVHYSHSKKCFFKNTALKRAIWC